MSGHWHCCASRQRLAFRACAGKGTKLLSEVLSHMDRVEDRWYLYRLGQELGACSHVKASFKHFVRTFVLGVEQR